MLALISADAFTATSAAVAVVATGWLASLIALRMVNVRPVRGGPVREVLAFGLKTVPASLASMANTRLDQMLVAPLISASALGVYSVAVGATILPLSVGVAIALAGFHTVKATAGFDGAAALLRKACVVIPACAAVNALGIILFLEPIYGHQFSGSVVPALILIPGATATALFMVVAPVGARDRGSIARLLEPGCRPRRHDRGSSCDAACSRHQRRGARLVGRLHGAAGRRCLAVASSGRQLWATPSDHAKPVVTRALPRHPGNPVSSSAAGRGCPRPRWNCRCVPRRRRHAASTREAAVTTR